MRETYATSFNDTNHCAAYRRGVLLLYRKSDKASCALTLRETNAFAPIQADAYASRMKPHKAIEVLQGGNVLIVHRAWL